MKIDSIYELAGPNIYSYRPVLVMRLDLEDLAERESREIEGFDERLIALLPGIREHHCSRGYPGGFIERLEEGTYFGHVVEHVTLELSEHAGTPVNLGRTRYAGTPGCYNIAVAYASAPAMRYLLETAVALVEALARGEEFPMEQHIREARRIVAETELGPTTAAIVEAARRRKIPCTRIGDNSLVQLGYGKHRKFIQAAMCCSTSAIGVDISCDKELTKTLLRQASLPVPRGCVVRTEEEAIDALASVGGPVVVKPLDGRQGLGVSLNLTTAAEVVEAFGIARSYSPEVLVEEQIEGRNFRVMVVNNRVVAASERLPAHVVGDGVHTIAELVAIANEDPLRGEGHEKPLTKIVIDPIVEAHLHKSGFTLDDIPPAEEMVFLRDGINLSTGGIARDVTDTLHPSVASLCERAARVVGLDICGVDLVAVEVAAPLRPGTGAIIEVNAAPGLRMHHFPSDGKSRDVGGAIIDMLYPPGTPSRIPIIAITGTNGKTSVTRMISHVIASTGKTVGTTTTDGIYINEQCIVEGDTTGPQSARTILGDPSIEVAVLETARGGIVRRGLGYDWSDVAVMTNIQPDHFGQDGIEDLDDLVYIKSLVAERVRHGGTLVLNADDPHLVTLTEIDRIRRVPKNIVYFSLDSNNPFIARHIEKGGTAYFMKQGWIVEGMNGMERWLIRASLLPMTLGGTALYQIQNVLAAIAACRAHGIATQQIAQALLAFRGKSHNPGRSNFYRLPGGAHVMVDYGHNPEAFKAVCAMASQWKGKRVTGIVGVPGDRDDALIAEAGRIAAIGFDRVIVREDDDLRGRRPGEVAGILCAAVHEAVPERECLTILDVREALERQILAMNDGDVAVLFFEKLDQILELLERHGARPVESIDGLSIHPELVVATGAEGALAWPAITEQIRERSQGRSRPRKSPAHFPSATPPPQPKERRIPERPHAWITTASWSSPLLPPPRW